MKIALVVPPLHCFVNEIGHGYMPPLGLLSIGGPLIDAGFDVTLVDADAGHLDDRALSQRLVDLDADAILIGHSGSMAAHPTAMQVVALARRARPAAKIIYGGVYPTFAAEEVMRQSPALDVVVRGEGEACVVDLLGALQRGEEELGRIRGLVWRRGSEIVVNRLQKPIEDLDAFRRAWELVDWRLYRCLQRAGRTAVVQFSRGCPNACSFCGQWRFWECWRRRSVESFVAELELLRRDHDVRTVWIADENWACDAAVFRRLLNAIAERALDIDIYCAQCAEDVVRDADLLPLYKRAGVLCLMMGVESLDPRDLAKVGKHHTIETVRRAVALLRRHRILSIVNKVYGIRDESWRSLLHSAWQFRRLAPDFFNAMHLTPLPWTPEQRRLGSGKIARPDLRRWDFRQPVIWPEKMSLSGIAVAVKMVEAFVCVRPLWALRRLFDPDRAIRRTVRDALLRLVRVYLREWRVLLRGDERGALRRS